MPHQNSAVVTAIDEHTLMPHYHSLWFTLGFTVVVVHSISLDKCMNVTTITVSHSTRSNFTALNNPLIFFFFKKRWFKADHKLKRSQEPRTL